MWISNTFLWLDIWGLSDHLAMNSLLLNLNMSQCHYCAKNKQAVLDVPREARWQVCHRLQQLSIDAVCNRNGSLIVEVDDGVAIAQIHSVVRQFVGSRSTLVDWLDVCWTQPMVAQAR